MSNRNGNTYESRDAWIAKGTELFGPDASKWRFICPACKVVRTSDDYRPYKDKGAEPDDVYCKCLGRFTGGRKGPHKCDWAAFGLFRGPNIVKHEGEEYACFMFDGE